MHMLRRDDRCVKRPTVPPLTQLGRIAVLFAPGTRLPPYRPSSASTRCDTSRPVAAVGWNPSQ